MFFCTEKRSRSRRPRSVTWRCTWPARQTRPKLTSLASPSLENRERMRQERKKRRKKVSTSAVQAFHKWLFNSTDWIKHQVVNVEFPVRKTGNESEFFTFIFRKTALLLAHLTPYYFFLVFSIFFDDILRAAGGVKIHTIFNSIQYVLYIYYCNRFSLQYYILKGA